MNNKQRTALVFCGLFASSSAMAFDGVALATSIGMSVLYGFLGIIMAIIGYKIFEAVLPFDVAKELSEDDNPAVGVLMGAVVLGVSIIMAAAIHG